MSLSPLSHLSGHGSPPCPTDDQLQATSRVGLRADQWPIARNQRISISKLGLSRLGISDCGFRIFVRKTSYFKPLQRALTMVACTIFIEHPASSIQYRVTSRLTTKNHWTILESFTDSAVHRGG